MENINKEIDPFDVMGAANQLSKYGNTTIKTNDINGFLAEIQKRFNFKTTLVKSDEINLKYDIECVE